jgi:rRNA maturation endonuclease Nob1
VFLPDLTQEITPDWQIRIYFYICHGCIAAFKDAHQRQPFCSIFSQQTKINNSN